MKASALIATFVTILLVLPSFAWGELDAEQASIAAIHAFASAFIVLLFAPQLARFVR